MDAMTSKERMMRALNREKPDRLPVTIHQWQQYHLDTYMGGMDALSAFQACGLDAAIQYFEAMGQFWIPEAERYVVATPQWRHEAEVMKDDPWDRVIHHTIETPEGTLTFRTGANPQTTWITEYLIKRHEDVDLIEKYMPVATLDKDNIARAYDEVGDAGVLRGFVWGDQAGCWQHACCLMDVQELILEAFDNPDWVHRLLRVLLDKKLRFVGESLKGAKFDLIETGGGAGSDTVISPAMHREFCLPYDREIHRAVHDAGLRVTYHTCGGMVHLLDLIVQNETDASETLSPPGTGGNVADPSKVREAFAGKVAMIGGMDQFHVLTSGTAEQIRAEVHRLFEGFGPDGGYILSASDHFFETPPENLKAYAEAARECTY
jgi:uroporphyrinogen decarboxylase